MPHLAIVALALLVLVVLTIVASPALRAWLRGTGSIRQTLSNAGVGILFLGSQLLLRGTQIAVFAGVAALVPYKLPPTAPRSFVVAFVLLDFVYYVQHRIEHSAPLLWAVHSVHHQSRDYNLSVSFRVGVLASLSTLAFHGALALADVSATQYAAVVTLHGALLFAPRLKGSGHGVVAADRSLSVAVRRGWGCSVARSAAVVLCSPSSALQKFGQGWPNFWPRCAGGCAGAKLACLVGAAPHLYRLREAVYLNNNIK